MIIFVLVEAFCYNYWYDSVFIIILLQGAQLQYRCNQQVAELKRQEQQMNRMREKLSQLSDRNKDRGMCESHMSCSYIALCWMTSPCTSFEVCNVTVNEL